MTQTTQAFKTNGYKEEFFEGGGGIRLFARSWRPSTRARAIIVAVHGFKLHSAMFEWAGEQLSARGFAVYALDLRGHGKSDGERLFTERFTDYTADVDELVRLARAREGASLPLFVLGHSAGGVISSMYTLEHQQELAGFICESFAHEIPAPEIALAVLKMLSHVAPHLHVLKLDDDDFSRDKAFVERMKNDPLIPRMAYPAQTVAEMVRADERLKQDLPRFMLPLLIMHGTDDKVTLPTGSKRFHESASSTDKTLKLYDGHFHDLLNDLGKERVMADVLDWLEMRIQA